jgi:OPA family sugar phosphate sensor protein UhpC-like MFS transporter
MANPLRALLDWFRTGPDRPVDPNESPESIRRRYERNRWSVFVSVTLGYGIFYICRLNFSVVKKPMLDENILSATEMGIIGSALLIAYAGGKLVNGFLADRANIRRFMSLGLLMVGLVNVALGFADILKSEPVRMLLGGSGLFLTVAALWGVNGWFQATGAPGSIVSLSQWFSQKERGSRYGIWCTSHNIGEALTFIITAFLVSHMGWRWGFWGPGLICVGTAFILFKSLADRPRTLGLPLVGDYKNDPSPQAAPTESVGRLQLEVLRNPAVWVLGLASACMYVARYGINNWGVLYLQEGKSYSVMHAGTILAIYSFAGMAGSLASGLLSDYLFNAKRNLPCLLAGLLQIASLIAFFLIPPGHMILDIAAMTVFGFAMGILVSFLGGLMAIDIVSPRAAGAAAGVVGMFSYIGAAIQDTASGVLIDRSREVTETATTYDFTGAFWFWIGASILSMLLALLVWNAGDKAAHLQS